MATHKNCQSRSLCADATLALNLPNIPPKIELEKKIIVITLTF